LYCVKSPPVPFGLRGGDFLPGFRNAEVEIPRMSLESTTWDVVSIRARPSTKGILFKILDEYATAYEFRPKSFRRPLSLRQVIQMIDALTSGGGVAASPAALRDFQCLDDAESIRRMKTFVTVSSNFYPGLQAWYEGRRREVGSRKASRIANSVKEATGRS
jgi:hypothetical protein